VPTLGGNPIFAVEIKGPSAFRANSWQRASSLVDNYRAWLTIIELGRQL
jgi:hypothetical protein